MSSLLSCWIRRASSSMSTMRWSTLRGFLSFPADSRPIDELMDILAKPASAVDNAYRPGAPAPESIPMTYTSSSSSISTYSATSPLSFSPLDTTPDYRVERKKRSPQRKGRGASLEPQISPCEYAPGCANDRCATCTTQATCLVPSPSKPPQVVYQPSAGGERPVRSRAAVRIESRPVALHLYHPEPKQ